MHEAEGEEDEGVMEDRMAMPSYEPRTREDRGDSLSM